MRRNSLTSVFALLTLPCGVMAPALVSAQQVGGFECTLVIGYSQVRQWYTAEGAFETIVDDARWELKAPDGAGVNVWANPESNAWKAEIASPCTTRSAAEPDRIVFGISGPFGDNEAAWAASIRDALGLIRQRYATARSFVLIPVAGGPNHGDCTNAGRLVRASWQHKHIDAAIEMVIDQDASGAVTVGPSPEVSSCEGYSDFLGHLTDIEAELIGRAIAAQFVESDGG